MQFGCLFIHKPLVIFFPYKKPLTKAQGEKIRVTRQALSVWGRKKAYGMNILACSIKKQASKKQNSHTGKKRGFGKMLLARLYATLVTCSNNACHRHAGNATFT